MEKIDKLDKKIICELDINCRQSHAMIGKKVGASRAVVSYRILNLEKKGIISQYITSVNLGKLGFSTYKIYFKLHNLNQEDEKKLFEFFKERTEVIHCLRTQGSYDASVSVAVKSLKQLDKLLCAIKNGFSTIIFDYNLSLIVGTSIFKLDKVLLERKLSVPKEPKVEKFSTKVSEIIVDDIDKKILRIISKRADMPIVEIAKKSKLSVDVIKYRLKKMLHDGIVSSFRVLLNPNKVGFYHYVIMLKTRRSTKEDHQKLKEWCNMHNYVLYISKRIGNWDYEINVALKDIDHLNNFLKDLRNSFSEVIDSYETIINSEAIKLNYFP
ncbi:Lrp/AsnC family transcriptional regulator [Nanoarchaeota archaeon]